MKFAACTQFTTSTLISKPLPNSYLSTISLVLCTSHLQAKGAIKSARWSKEKDH
jgi:hypothetical protein